jgi:hypothetical protein
VWAQLDREEGARQTQTRQGEKQEEENGRNPSRSVLERLSSI